MAAGPVLVVDFGAQYAQLIARRVREANVYSELVPHSMPVDEMLAKDPQAIILSGGPASVFEPGAPRVDKKLFEAGVPVLGICYGFQAMAYALGADVDKAALGEYGKTETFIDKSEGLLDGSPADQNTWMSHGVAVKTAPEGFEVLAHTEGAPVAAMQDESRKLYGVQWHPEVKHTPMGQQLIETFLHKCAGLGNNWDASSIIEDQVAKIREKVGDAQVICGLSGGVDSAVAAALVHKAIGDQLTCVFVDHGLLRKGEAEQVKHDFVEATGIKLIAVDASEVKVTKDAKPFIVKTDYLQTKVLGTEFNVKSYTAEDSHVTLISGKVQVRSHENARFVDLEPGKDAMLLSDGLFEVKEVNSEAYTYWKDGYFYFDELPLADIMKSIGRWYNVNVTFRNKEAMAYRIHFMSNRQSGIEETIRLMNRLKKVTLTLCENTVYVD